MYHVIIKLLTILHLRIKINSIPVAGNADELSVSAMIPIINDCEGMFPDDTSVTTSEPADFDTVKLVEEKSINVSVKKLENFSY